MQLVLAVLAIGYAAMGLATAACVLAGLAGRFDPAARKSSWGFRLVVLPGVAFLWPFVLRAAVRGEGASDRTAHDMAADEGTRT